MRRSLRSRSPRPWGAACTIAGVLTAGGLVAGCAAPAPATPASASSAAAALVRAGEARTPERAGLDALVAPAARTADGTGTAEPLPTPRRTVLIGDPSPAPTFSIVAPARPTPSVAPASRPSPLVSVPRSARQRPSRGGMTMRPTAAGPLSGRTVTIDPGHNGVVVPSILNHKVPAGNGRTKACNTTGTGNSRQSEHALNWALASQVAAQLRARGATVVMTRPDDHGVGPCVDERAAIGNRTHSDLVLSLHADGNTSRGARGFHVIRSTRMAGGRTAQARSTEFALRVRSALEGTGMPRSTYLGHGTAITPRTDLAGLNLSRIPAAMVELGNMNDGRDAALMRSSTFRTRTARALADAVQRQLLGR